jgi:hypothetical protein
MRTNRNGSQHKDTNMSKGQRKTFLDKQTRKDYVDGAATSCPYCDSTEIENQPGSASFDCVASIEVECNDCGATWREFYALRDIEEVSRPCK